MRFYGGYKLGDVLELKAKRFYYFLNEAYKLKAEEEEMLAFISCLPNMKENDRRNFFRSLSVSKSDIIDIGRGSDDYSGLEQLKKELGQNGQ
jgi:hypothetical protein